MEAMFASIPEEGPYLAGAPIVANIRLLTHSVACAHNFDRSIPYDR